MTIPDLAVWAVEVTERKEEEMPERLTEGEEPWTYDALAGRHLRKPPATLRTFQARLHAAQDVVAERRQELQAAVLQARENRSLADIARELGVSKQRVDQIARGR